MHARLLEINKRPEPFSRETAAQLWTDPHRSKQMLRYHLDASTDIASRRATFVDASVRWLSERFRLGPGKSVVDLGCGPGLYANQLATTGADVLGVDFSPHSIEYARQQAAGAGVAVEYATADYLTYETPRRFDLALMIFLDYCVISPEKRRRLLANVRTLLRPGGHFVFDVMALPAFEAKQESASYAPSLQDGFFSPNPYFGFFNSFKYEKEKVSLDKYEIVEEGGTVTLYDWFQYFDPASLAAEVEESGLEVREVIGDVAGAPYDPAAHEFAVIARKPID